MSAPNIDPNHPVFKAKCLCVQSDQDVDCPVHGSLAHRKALRKSQAQDEKSRKAKLIKSLINLAKCDKNRSMEIIFDSLTIKQLIKVANNLIAEANKIANAAESNRSKK